MTTLRCGNLSISAADIGPNNPLPPLRSVSDLHASDEIHGVDPEMDAGIRYGRLTSILPYLLQDGYGRDRKQASLDTIVLENDILRATFLPGYGGRLWSLIDIGSGRELLHRNPIFQPANLALRNAWFAGGVEWNIGATGHTPLTCSPLHAVRVAGPEGAPVLRLYEWERIREVVYSLDFWLPAGSPMLFVGVRIVNPQDHDVPMYWWSNIAIPQTDDLRILAPADSAYQFGYGKTVHTISIPVSEGEDLTYPASRPHASDVFFDTGGSRTPWIAGLDRQGIGLVQASTQLLRGRKLFVWGQEGGGRKWQEFLSGPDASYCEIQAGLARTQLERLRMPSHAQWSWVEAYGKIEADPIAVHGSDWELARDAVERELTEMLPDLNAIQDQFASWADQEPEEILQHGSGWGALEQRRRHALDCETMDLPGTPFDAASLGPEQAPWLELLESRVVPSGEPCSYVGSSWRSVLDDARDTPEAWLHRGVIAWQEDRRDDARAAWAQAPESWLAKRNLAVASDDPAAAAELFLQAHADRPDLLPLTVETLRGLLRAGRPETALGLIDEELRTCNDGRVRMIEIESALALGNLDRVAAVFASGFIVPDIREGETSLSDLWFAFQEMRVAAARNRPLQDTERRQIRTENPVPRDYDFRVN